MFTSNLAIKNESIIGDIKKPHAAPIIQGVDAGFSCLPQTCPSNMRHTHTGCC